MRLYLQICADGFEQHQTPVPAAKAGIVVRLNVVENGKRKDYISPPTDELGQTFVENDWMYEPVSNTLFVAPAQLPPAA